METGDRDLREKIIRYLKASNGHTLREVARFVAVTSAQALQCLHDLQQEGLATYAAKDDLWRASC